MIVTETSERSDNAREEHPVLAAGVAIVVASLGLILFVAYAPTAWLDGLTESAAIVLMSSWIAIAVTVAIRVCGIWVPRLFVVVLAAGLGCVMLVVWALAALDTALSARGWGHIITPIGLIAFLIYALLIGVARNRHARS
jgi:hypothetical protein